MRWLERRCIVLNSSRSKYDSVPSMRSGNITTLSVANTVAYALMIMINALAGSTALIGGQQTSEVSNTNSTLVTPAGFTFAIWGLIYLLLGIFVAYQLVVRPRLRSSHGRIGWLFILSSALNMLWLFAWQYELLVVSVIIMLLLLGSLIAIYLRLGVGKEKVGFAERLAVHLPFSVYLGWITVATVANISAALVSIGWGGFGIAPELWAIAVLLLILAITVTIAFDRRDVAFGAVIVWALAGVAANQSDNPSIVAAAVISAVVIVAVFAVSLLRIRRGSPRTARV